MDLSCGFFHVIPVPCLKDNYAYLIADSDQGTAIIIDPSDSNTVLNVLQEKSLKPIAILNTHHHWDHTAGNTGLVQHYPGLSVYGSSTDFYGSNSSYARHTTHFVDDGHVLQLGRATLKVIETPCHTRGSVLFLLDLTKSLPFNIPESQKKASAIPSSWDPNAPCVFTGDTFMTAGCGRFFEAKSPYDMNLISTKTLGLIPKNANIFPGHEYAISNLTFASTMEPTNMAIQSKLSQAKQARELNIPLVPTSWTEECSYNPYLRLDSKHRSKELWDTILSKAESVCLPRSNRTILDAIKPDVLQHCAGLGLSGDIVDEVVAMGCLRALKDQFAQ
ncbi:Cytoplasmic glyoxalase II [Batrachochytrium dendrobatidis]